jgi:hypothetical protein
MAAMIGDLGSKLVVWVGSNVSDTVVSFAKAAALVCVCPYALCCLYAFRNSMHFSY